MAPRTHLHSWLFALAAAALLLSTASGRGAPARAQDAARPGEDSLAQLSAAVVPPRDRLDLARRLLGVTDIPAPPTVAPPELALGTVETFWADNIDQDRSFQLEAELVYKTPHLYVFVERGQQVDLNALKRSADTFEQAIYPTMHEIFGTEWTSGIDGDPHLYILHATGLGSTAAAYYYSPSEYPRAAVPNSNEHEMFFVNLDTMDWAIGSPYYEGVLTHEFQHMIQWHTDQNEDTWMNEGLSELASMLAGYGPSGFIPSFMSVPDIQLNTWPEDGNRPAHYGGAFMFLAYFYDRYGEEATKALVRDPNNGLESVAETLAAIDARDPSTGEPVTLVDLFADWVAALALQNPKVGDGRYDYTHPDMQSLPTPTLLATLRADGQPLAVDGRQWTTGYLYLQGGSRAQRVQVSIEGQPTVSLVPTDAHSGRYMWWGNRADDSDAHLTRAFDLSGVDRATLSFWTWYYIEDRWDYGYVMISTDDGATWTPLATGRTVSDDPHGNAYGPGYTGQSGGWVQEQVDLTPYAGQPIQVRFEYITDDAVTQPGFIVDDVSIPEIGFADDFETESGGWVSEGWLRTDNLLPQHFLAQAIQPGSAAQPVTRWLDQGTGPSGAWELTVGGEWGDAAIAVSGLAPVTTEPARYTITVTTLE